MFSNLFISRPILATVCSLLIILAGAVAIPNLPIARYPELIPPSVTVTAFYTGANAQAVESAVTTPLEQAINGVEGMVYMTSSSTNSGVATITVTFAVGRNHDLAAIDVQNRVNQALGRMPADVRTTGVTVTKNTAGFLGGLGFYSRDNRYSAQFLSNYVDLYVKDALKRVPGVGNIIQFGERKFAMRLWLDPAKLAARELTAGDVVNALREQNLQVAAGALGDAPAPVEQVYQISVRAMGRLSEAPQFEDIVVKAGRDGALVRVRDVGRVELGAETYSSNLRYGGLDAAGLGIQLLPSANALETFQGVSEEMARLEKSFPPGLEWRVAFDNVGVVRESIIEVLKTLAEAIGLVVLVMFLFLQNWRSTLIPAITIPVSLIGTFAFMYLFNFSINTLTLFGIVLATGIVVDDAIVVIENIERHMREEKKGAFEAAIDAMREVFGAVVVIGIVLVAVFVPVAFFPGTTGRLVSAVFADDRLRDDSVGVQCGDVDARALGLAARSPAAQAGAILPVRQLGDRWRHGLVCAHRGEGAAVARRDARPVRRRAVGHVGGVPTRALGLRAAGGRRLLHEHHPGAAWRVARVHDAGRAGSREDHPGGSRDRRCVLGARIQLHRCGAEQRHDVRAIAGLGASSCQGSVARRSAQPPARPALRHSRRHGGVVCAAWDSGALGVRRASVRSARSVGRRDRRSGERRTVA